MPPSARGQKPSPLAGILDAPRRHLCRIPKARRAAVPAGLKDFVNGVTLPRCYGVVTAEGGSQLQPIDACSRIPRFEGYPVDEMHFISTLRITRIRVVVNYFSPVSFCFLSVNGQLFGGRIFYASLGDPLKRETAPFDFCFGCFFFFFFWLISN